MKVSARSAIMVASVIISAIAKIILRVTPIVVNASVIVDGWEKRVRQNVQMVILELIAERNVLIICHRRLLVIM